jgi:hypothetical protein
LDNRRHEAVHQIAESVEPIAKQSNEKRQLARWLEGRDRQLGADQREIDKLKQKYASVNALSDRRTALEQQVRTANSARLDSLARK